MSEGNAPLDQAPIKLVVILSAAGKCTFPTHYLIIYLIECFKT